MAGPDGFCSTLAGAMPISSEDCEGSREGATSPAPWIATGLRTCETYSLDVAAGIVGAAIFLQSYAIADGPGEGCPDDRPGPVLRVATVMGVALLVSVALFLDPEYLGPWLALASTGVLQVALPGLPSGLVHPLGEWGFALLALVGLGR